MRYLLSCVLASVILLGLTACGSSTADPSTDTVVQGDETAEAQEMIEESQGEQTQSASDSTPLVLYFSRVGNTDFPVDVDAVSSASIIQTEDGIVGNAQLIAQWMAEENGGVLAEIQTAEKYPVDYTETTDFAKEEQNQNARPSLATKLEGIDSYSDVYLVFPNWWADLPMALYSFFDAYDLTGKTLYVSVTHGGSGFSRTLSTIQDLEPGVQVVEGLSIRDSDVPGAEDTVRQWARENHG